MNSSKSYSFTLTIFPEKKVYYAGKKRAYGSLSQQSQAKLINNVLVKSIFHEHFEFVDWIFEEHIDGRLHVHGFTIVKPEYVNQNPTNLLVYNFYTYNQIIQVKSIEKIQQLSNVQETKVNLCFWEQYIEKQQDKIKFLSPYREEQKNIKDLNKGIVIIQQNNPKRPNDWYDDILNESDTPKDNNPTYKFGMKNKFIVEL